MEFTDSIINSGQLPALTAFLLGLIVALHPCLLVTNIAAMGYIAKDADTGRRVFMRGLSYTAGRIVGYAVLGLILAVLVRRGLDILSIGDALGEWGERLLGPLLIIIGVYLMTARFIHKEHRHTVGGKRHGARGMAGSFTLGILLALSFCPESAIVYFGMIIPMSAKSQAGYLLPTVFAVATSVPAVILAWCFASGVTNISAVRDKMHILQQWMSVSVALLFIIAGIFCLVF